MRKDYRQNYRAGTNPFGRKSNLQKIAETFGPKKKVKKIGVIGVGKAKDYPGKKLLN